MGFLSILSTDVLRLVLSFCFGDPTNCLRWEPAERLADYAVSQRLLQVENNRWNLRVFGVRVDREGDVITRLEDLGGLNHVKEMGSWSLHGDILTDNLGRIAGRLG